MPYTHVQNETQSGTNDKYPQVVLTSRRHEIHTMRSTTAGRAASILRTLRRKCPQTKIVLAGVLNREQTIVNAFASGAAGVVSDDESLPALRQAIEQVSAFGVCPPPNSALPALIRRLVVASGSRTNGHVTVATASLSQREAEILGRLEVGASNKEIAVTLGIEVQTVKNHMRRLFRKLHVKSRLDATPAGLRTG